VSLVHSNLGGFGPDVGDEGMRYANVGRTSDGETINLMVNVDYTATHKVVDGASAYAVYRNWKNGRSGKFGIINLMNNHGIDVEFRFVDDENKPVVLDAFEFDFFDIDAGKYDDDGSLLGVEKLRVFDYTKYTNSEAVGIASTVAEKDDADGGYFIGAREGFGSDNPTDPLKLTNVQVSSTVKFFFQNKSSFKMSFSVLGGSATKGRNLMFATESALLPPCATSA